MKKIQNLMVCMFAAFVIVSCGDDVDCTESVLEMKAIPLVDALFNAESAYNSDSSEENCKTYKDALEEYKEFFQDHKECAEESGQIEDYNEGLAELNLELARLDC
ncbi:MAG: hypothetical protein HKO66_11265 [Saprospiraceae bacterium]|nr:hypothetical protein [Bacteroidia bacterium]NNE14107.1 hypothetical protein [Saprospiraceae bacterium]NNL92805.1 hypothetical protein [Saprospiraceae bacterium]